MIVIALALYFLRIYRHPPNNMNSINLKSAIENEKISLWNNPSINIDAPADPIRATTAGLSEDRTV